MGSLWSPENRGKVILLSDVHVEGYLLIGDSSSWQWAHLF